MRLAPAIGLGLLLIARPAFADDDVVAQARQAVAAERLAEAQALLTPYIAAHPGDDEATFLLARVLAWRDQRRASLALYDGLLARHPVDADLLTGAGQTLVWDGRAQEATPLLARARAARPDDEALWRLSIKALAAAGDTDAALKLQAEATSRFPGATWRLVSKPSWLEIELGTQLEHLTNGFADWQTRHLAWQGQLPRGVTLYGDVRDVHRFNLADQELQLGGGGAPAEGWQTSAEATFSPSAQVLPRWSVDAEVRRALPGAFGLQLGARRTEFRATANNRASLLADRSFGPVRASYSLSVTQIPGSHFPLGHQVALGWDYGERNFEVLSLAAGQEMEYVGPDRLLTSDVRAATLRGRHWLGGGWALTHELGWVSQGSIYQRIGGQVGVRHGF